MLGIVLCIGVVVLKCGFIIYFGSGVELNGWGDYLLFGLLLSIMVVEVDELLVLFVGVLEDVLG